ncbi:M10 family metallopeptidase C-terminal domain-containing protein [Qipengyuania sp. 1NDH17]|uniref:M10 family metallopeptidase C-terminal domain-containing protein n=1 Tax=Qipengyuania polymorpha TaxID=2867234 RepID=A0ABS7J057_9SPHN|nr:M10 family metallopeptidase C-terminal domain-containing protein [Qipengyuania polymorpha]MBX7459196.1 M10 family metallopeptidase C-terminal domain-containing protein [Qipengyuania polymorpha]
MFEVEPCCACSVCKSDSRTLMGGETIVTPVLDAKDHYASGSVVYANGEDIPGNASTTATISVGESVTDELEAVGDTDWFRIELEAGQTISISLSGTGSNPVPDTYLAIYNSSGFELARNDDGGDGLNSLMRFTASTTGTYYIEADSYNSLETGEYTLTVSEAAPLELFTIDQISDQLTEGYWGGSQRSFEVGVDGIITVDITTLNATEQSLAREALLLWGDVIGITFQEVGSNAEITFTNNLEGAYSLSSRSGTRIISSDVNINSSWIPANSDFNSYAFQTYLHEIGHALGLGHAGNYNGDASYANEALYLNDGWPYTVMSYFDVNDNTYLSQEGFSFAYVGSPMMADVAAMIDLYGASTTTRLGSTVYGFNSTSDRAIHDANQYPTVAYTIVDSGGAFDELDYSGFSQDQLIDLREESFSNIGGLVGNVSIARGTVIEWARAGSGADTVYGNAADNLLQGNGGDDYLSGFDGNDQISGNAGNDIIYGGVGEDKLYGNDNNDEIRGGLNNDEMHGGNGDDTLYGSNGYDSIYGGLGNDTAAGGNGNDTLFGEDGNDWLNGNLGKDFIRGGAGNDNILGGEGGDRLFGDDGDDTMDGEDGTDEMFGGLGQDTMQGGLGNDVIEGEGGNDFLYGEGGDDVMLGGAGWDKLFGSEGADELSGGNGGDLLSGGFGVDILTGGSGPDTFEMEMFGDANMNIITDFDTAEDSISLRRNVGFGELAWGQLSESAFAYGTQASDANDRIIYQWSTGKLFYDPDGVGGEQAYLFAQVTAQTALKASHFTALGASAPPPPLGGTDDAILGADTPVL